MRYFVAVLLLVGLVGCQTTSYTPAQSLLVSCKAYARTLTALAGYRAAGELTEDQVATVDEWRPILNDACTGEVPVTQDLLTAVEDALLKLIAIEQEQGS